MIRGWGSRLAAWYFGSTVVLLTLFIGVYPALTRVQERYLFGYVSTAMILVPVAFELYLKDREAHKECPDCGEQVLAKARVCKHCGFRWEPPLPNPAGSVANEQ
jgi:predicted RNA-binding Zn-ribbon protein involved in translation (DUF1610 family)